MEHKDLSFFNAALTKIRQRLSTCVHRPTIKNIIQTKIAIWTVLCCMSGSHIVTYLFNHTLFIFIHTLNIYFCYFIDLGKIFIIFHLSYIHLDFKFLNMKIHSKNYGIITWFKLLLSKQKKVNCFYFF